MSGDASMSLSGWLDEQSQRTTACLVDGGRPMSWSELARRSASVAAGLAELGVHRGDRVGLWLPNRAAWLVTFFACARLGAAVLALNTRLRSAEIGDLLHRSAAKVLVYWPDYKAIDFAGVLAQCQPQELNHLRRVVLYTESTASLPKSVLNKPATSFERLLGHAPLPADAQGGSGSSSCLLVTTSGTTRAPKLVVHAQAGLLAHARNVARQWGLDGSKRFLLLPPLCGVFGFCGALAALTAGSLLVMESGWSPTVSADLIDQHRITHLVGSDEAMAQLIDARPGGNSLKSLEVAGIAQFSPAHADLPRRAAARGVKVVGVYGSSELQALLARRDAGDDLPLRGLAGGRLASEQARVRARDPETQALVAPGEPGELEFLAPESRFHDYFHDVAATAAATTPDGWFKSGDLGTVEADGRRFTFLARMGDTLRLGGFLVAPEEIEAVLREHGSVAGCQVVGARTSAGLRAVAFVTLRAGVVFDEPALIQHVEKRLASFKVPLRVIAVESFPTTPGANGAKVQKNKLRDLAETVLSQA